MTMLEEAQRQQLVEQFRAGLQQIEDDSQTWDEAADDGVDLSSLLTEMAVLKNEVRLQARQFKAALEQLQTLADGAQEHNRNLQREMERSRQDAAQNQARAERSLLLELLELRDRLHAGQQASRAWQPTGVQRWFNGGAHGFVASLAEGATLTLQRLDALLQSHRVRPIPAVGQALDPQTMQAIAVEHAPGVPPGQVIREARRGYLHGGVLLRTAEVIVNRPPLNQESP